VDTRTTSVLTLELYLSNEERLIPKGADPDQLRTDPRAVILIDGRRYPVTMFFGEDYIVLADPILDHTPFLSRRLIDGMQFGSTMVIRFVLLSGRRSPDAAFDGTASFDLQAGAGGTVIAAVRRCAEPSLGRVSGH
jgi:hypothetical protein